MSTPKSELYVITSAKKLAGYVLDLTEKCPKKFRYSYLVRIEECCLSIVSLHYYDRIVQHCLVDNYLMPLLERHLIYDNGEPVGKKRERILLGTESKSS